VPEPLWRTRAGAIKHLQPADGTGGEREDPGLQFGCQKGRLAREHATAPNSARQQRPDPLADGLRLNERRPSLHVRLLSAADAGSFCGPALQSLRPADSRAPISYAGHTGLLVVRGV
jgi:hypothetical protein